MNKYIDADKLKAEIERLYYNEAEKDESILAADAYKNALDAVKKFLDSLQQEQPNYKEAVQLVFEEELTPFKDGNQWCFLLGHNIQDGICGFGDTILDATVAFYKDYMNTKIHIGELKISMAQQKQPEVDLEREIIKYKVPFSDEREYLNEDTLDAIARHFYELGVNSKKEESPEIGLDEFAEKIKIFQARYGYPKIVSIKGAMAFMARMFYQYPNIAREWYEQLPKATMD